MSRRRSLKNYIKKQIIVDKIQKLESELKKAYTYIDNYQSKIKSLEELCLRIKGALLVLREVLNETSS